MESDENISLLIQNALKPQETLRRVLKKQKPNPKDGSVYEFLLLNLDNNINFLKGLQALLDLNEDMESHD